MSKIRYNNKAGYRDILHTTGDSVKDRLRHERGGNSRVDIPLLNRARTAWENFSEVRKRRLRNLRYVFGDQWGDLVYDKEGNKITEREAMQNKGQVPLQNNHLVKIVNTLTGLYSKSATMPICFARQKGADIKSEMMTNALQTNWDNNRERELLTAAFLEMICGGRSVVCEEWATHDGVEDSYSYPVNPSYFFWESKMGDPREWDASMVGEIRDYTLDELAAELATDEYDYDELKKLYQSYMRNASGQSTTQINRRHGENYLSWDMPAADDLCRTYHIWTKESKVRYRCVDLLDTENPMYRIEVEDLPNIEEINKGRVQLAIKAGLITPDMSADDIKAVAHLIEYQKIYDQYWHFQMLTPWGEVLQELDSPYEHGGHPYTYRSYHFVNGDIIPFISCVIDQQRHINRLIMMKDMMMMAGAKGLKFIPSTLVPDDMTREEFEKQCVEIGGTIFYKPDPKNPQAAPQFFTNSAQDAGFSELLAMQVQSINEITAVSEALQGKTPGNGVAASRYAMETENSTTAVAALLQKFSMFEHDLAVKKMKTIHQFYQQPRYISHKRSSGYAEYSMYEPQEVKDIEFEVSIKEAPDSPVARMMINDFVMQLWQTGAINALQCLDNSYMPGSEDLKANLKAQLEAVQGGGAPQQIPQQQVDAMQPNSAAVQQLQGIMQQ